MIEINTTDVYCFVFNDLRSYAGNKYKHFVIYNAINEIQFINFYHNVYVFLTLYKNLRVLLQWQQLCFIIRFNLNFIFGLTYKRGLFYVWPHFVIRNVLDSTIIFVLINEFIFYGDLLLSQTCFNLAQIPKHIFSSFSSSVRLSINLFFGVFR